MQSSEYHRPRVIILGLDGATFDLLLPWVREGKLPYLAQLIKMGTRGELTSTIPPYTAAAWVSLATGENPGKHGIADFWCYAPGGMRTLVNSTSIRAPAIWSLLSDLERHACVVNVPLTYPPSPLNGLMVSGMMTPNRGVTYTYPPGLQAELQHVVGDYMPDPYASVSQDARFLRNALYWINQTEAANRYLWARDEWDLFFTVIQAPDPIQHQFWRFLDPTHPYHRPKEAAQYQALLLACYQAMDEAIGRRLDWLDERTTLFVVSDHGFGPAHKYFYVNRFLADLGLLVFDEQRAWPMRGRLMHRVRDFVRVLDVLNVRWRLLDNRQREALRHHLDMASTPPLDWACTRAFYGGLTGEGIYLNVSHMDSYETTRDLIIVALKQLRDPETGEPVVEAVYRREEIYHGPWVHLMPDIVFSIGDRPYLPSERFSAESVIEPIAQHEGGGRHRSNGVLLMAGPHIRRGHWLSGAHIVDVAPTVLYTLDLPIPADMDGRVLLEAVDPSYVASHPVRHEVSTGKSHIEPRSVYAKEDQKQVEERLRALGYLD